MLHEFFHAFQDSPLFYPGGIAQYAAQINSAGIRTTTPGYANLEFERAVFEDIANGYPSALSGATTDQQQAYQTWLSIITNNFTSYPNLISGTDAYNQFISNFSGFLNDFNNIPNNVYHSDLLSIAPNALINFLSNANPHCQ